MASWLVRSSPDDPIIVLCSWARHLTLTAPLSTGEFNAGGNPAMDWHLIQKPEISVGLMERRLYLYLTKPKYGLRVESRALFSKCLI